ncbi:MAG: nitrogen regulation protein NR(I) [Alphaproteobacteria bacterium]|nr:nitrogen regulation protein NR(I) [Alphaproteobacteria bacterium]
MNATILIADDDTAIRKVLAQALGRAGYEVRTASTAAALWQWIEAGDGQLVITDVVMPDEDGLDLVPRIRKLRPDLPVIVMSAQSTIMTALRATERGAYEYIAKPFDINRLISVVSKALSASSPPADAPSSGAEGLPIVGRSAAMQDIYRAIARLTATDLTVLITGESGTGKELVARVLHDFGKRRHGPFVALNMAAIPRELIESELFGHEKGAFTGAANRQVGRFEQAHGGTLFLDEIGDMPFEAQTRLLRVLQEGEFTTVGGRSPIRVDIRVIAATHRPLRSLVEQGLFRDDLFYRLNVVPLRVPPLRERLSDLPDLVRHFLRQSAPSEGMPRRLTTDALEQLAAHRWPGNVRELENVIKRIVVLSPADPIDGETVARALSATDPQGAGATPEASANLSEAVETQLARYFAAHGAQLPPAGLHERVLREIERPLLALALKATHGNQLRAAELLGLNRNTLRKKLRELQIPVVRGDE